MDKKISLENIWKKLSKKAEIQKHLPLIKKLTQFCEFINYSENELTDLLEKLATQCAKHPAVERLLWRVIQTGNQYKRIKIEHVPYLARYKAPPLLAWMQGDRTPRVAYYLNATTHYVTHTIRENVQIKIKEHDNATSLCHELNHFIWRCDRHLIINLTADNIILKILNEAQARAYNYLIDGHFPCREAIENATRDAWKNTEAYHKFLSRNYTGVRFDPTPRTQKLYAESLQLGIYRDLLMSNIDDVPQVLAQYNIHPSAEILEATIKEIKHWQKTYSIDFMNKTVSCTHTVSKKCADLHKKRTLSETGIPYDLNNGLHFFGTFNRNGLSKYLSDEDVEHKLDWANPIYIYPHAEYRRKEYTDYLLKTYNQEEWDFQNSSFVIKVQGVPSQFISRTAFHTFFQKTKGQKCAFKIAPFHADLCIRVKSDILENGRTKYKAGQFLRLTKQIPETFWSDEVNPKDIYTLEVLSLEEIQQKYAMYDAQTRLIEKKEPRKKTTHQRIITPEQKKEREEMRKKQQERVARHAERKAEKEAEYKRLIAKREEEQAQRRSELDKLWERVYQQAKERQPAPSAVKIASAQKPALDYTAVNTRAS